MIVPRKNTLKTMSYKNIPKYKEFFKAFYGYLLKSLIEKDKNMLQKMIESGKRDQTQALIKDFDDGYCPQKFQALKYVPAMVILLNFTEEGYDILYDKFKIKQKT